MAKTAFRGFPDETVDFLRALKANNDRQWFADNKASYDRAVKAPAEQFCAAMASELETLTGLAHTSRLYRLHRDLRFSRDKTPYNTHLHISFTPRVDGSCAPCWFFALETDRLILGAGIFAFDKPALEAFRARVLGVDGTSLGKLLEGYGASGIRAGKPDLARVPAGYPKDHPQGDLLRHKGLTAWIDIEDPATAARPGFLELCRGHFERLKPLFDWLIAAPPPSRGRERSRTPSHSG